MTCSPFLFCTAVQKILPYKKQNLGDGHQGLLLTNYKPKL
jgi:hypothetical protein